MGRTRDDDDRAPPGGIRFDWSHVPRLPRGLLLLALIPLALVLIAGYVWFIQRVEVPANHLLVLVRKVGAALPDIAGDQVVLYPALLEKLGEKSGSTRYKGILFEVKPEGRYFYDPFFWKPIPVQTTLIEQNEVGILVRRFGRPMTGGKVVATEPDERGPQREVLRQGRHNINPYAFEVHKVPPVRIPEGSVGVQVLFDGETPKNPNRYVVDKGERGVQPDVLPPGLYFNNPYAREISIIDVRSHTIELRAAEEIRFPSNDSFEILIEGTVEYAIRQDLAPYLLAAVGDHEDIKRKLVLPFIRSLARIEGSKLLAREFISGDTRRAFQDKVFEGLRKQCYEQGIEIRSTLIRRIEPPAEIAQPISDRQIADRQVEQYRNEIELAGSQAKLVEQEELQKQNQELGKARRDVVTTITEAQQGQSVALVEANQRLEVAKLELEGAKETAAAMLSRGQAEAAVALLEFEAKAAPLRDVVAAFGGGEEYAQYFLYQKLGPAVKSVMDSTDGPFADIFRAFVPPARTEPVRAAAPVEPQ